MFNFFINFSANEVKNLKVIDIKESNVSRNINQQIFSFKDISLKKL